MAPCRGSLPSVFFHSRTPSGSSGASPPSGSIFTVSKGVALETTPFLALITLPLFSLTPTQRF